MNEAGSAEMAQTYAAEVRSIFGLFSLILTGVLIFVAIAMLVL
jgi:hypothetical protein